MNVLANFRSIAIDEFTVDDLHLCFSIDLTRTLKNDYNNVCVYVDRVHLICRVDRRRRWFAEGRMGNKKKRQTHKQQQTCRQSECGATKQIHRQTPLLLSVVTKTARTRVKCYNCGNPTEKEKAVITREKRSKLNCLSTVVLANRDRVDKLNRKSCRR